VYRVNTRIEAHVADLLQKACIHTHTHTHIHTHTHTPVAVKRHVFNEANVNSIVSCEGHKVSKFVFVDPAHDHTIHLSQ